MTLPSLTLTPKRRLADSILLLGAHVNKGTITVHSSLAPADLASQLAAVGFTGGKDEVVRLPGTHNGPALAIVGLPENTNAEALRYAAGSAVRQIVGVEQITADFPATNDAELGAVLEGTLLGAYSFSGYHSEEAANLKKMVRDIEVIGSSRASADIIVAHAQIVADAVALVKDLVNTPASILYPETFVDETRTALEDLPITLTVWDEEDLKADGFGGILGVGQGSLRPPRLVKIDYNPAEARHHLALVGKGITFDSGGLSLKPATSMVGMKYDMTGAATVLAVCRAVAQLKLAIRVTGWLCLAENMPSGSAIRPNDVLRIRGGHTVEVLNTDAEGRLVLADGLAAASEEHPDTIIDVATLTGAATIALGTRYAAVMGSDTTVDSVVAAASNAGELLWPMPLPGELRANLSSDVADIANANPGNAAAGMLLAGVFLKEFIGHTSDNPEAPTIPWAHLDIAGAAKGQSAPYGYTGKGPTGVSVRTLVRWAEDISRR